MEAMQPFWRYQSGLQRLSGVWSVKDPIWTRIRSYSVHRGQGVDLYVLRAVDVLKKYASVQIHGQCLCSGSSVSCPSSASVGVRRYTSAASPQVGCQRNFSVPQSSQTLMHDNESRSCNWVHLYRALVQYTLSGTKNHHRFSHIWYIKDSVMTRCFWEKRC